MVAARGELRSGPPYAKIIRQLAHRWHSENKTPPFAGD
jgi:hypothetical protein